MLAAPWLGRERLLPTEVTLPQGQRPYPSRNRFSRLLKNSFSPQFDSGLDALNSLLGTSPQDRLVLVLSKTRRRREWHRPGPVRSSAADLR
jgi:hypothetical protein